MKPLGKVMLTPKGDYNSGTTYDVLDLVRYDHKSWISLKQQTGVVPTQNADWQLYTEDGNGIVNVSYVGVDPTDPDGLTDIYEISFTNTTPFQFKIRNGKDGSGGGGGASSWSDLRNKPFNTLGTDFKVDSNVLKLADLVTTKLSRLDIEENVSTALAKKADTATTLSGYGITNAYTKMETDSKFDTWHTYNGAVEVAQATTTGKQWILFHNVDYTKDYSLYFEYDGAENYKAPTYDEIGTANKSGVLGYYVNVTVVPMNFKLRIIK